MQVPNLPRCAKSIRMCILSAREQSYSVTVESPMRIMLSGLELDAVVVVVLVVVAVEALVVVAEAAPASEKSTQELHNALNNIPLLFEARHWL